MKRFTKCFGVFFAVFLAISASAQEPITEQSIAYRVAAIDAGRHIALSDTSVARAAQLLADVAQKYGVTQEKAADMAAVGRDKLLEKQIKSSLIDMLDGSLVVFDAWPGKKDVEFLASFIASYVVLRMEGMLHRDAINATAGFYKAIAAAGDRQHSKQQKSSAR
jgi:hypothetical protein